MAGGGPWGADGKAPGLRPALGGSWQNQAHVRLQLGRETQSVDADCHVSSGDRTVVAVLRSSSIGPSSEVARLVLRENGAISSS